MATTTASGATGPKLNHIGLPVLEYRGGKSTLVRGLRAQRDQRAHY